MKPYDQALVYSSALSAAGIAKSFIEEYHQVLEERYIFPHFLQAQQNLPLINTLMVQHNAARCLTSEILSTLTSPRINGPSKSHQLVYLLSAYIELYDPHSAREDTVVFPKFHQLVSSETFALLGGVFEKIEEQKFGKNGFESVVSQISQIEQALGIYDLNAFTPACSP